MKQPINKITLSLAVLLLIFFSCQRSNPGEKQSTPTSGKVTIYSDESFKPVIDPVVSVFNGIYNLASVTCVYKPETEAMSLFLKDKNSMVFVTRHLTAEESDLLSSSALVPKELHVASDAIALIVHPGHTDSLISVKQIRDILTGRISTWKQLGHKVEADSIRLVFDTNGSSTLRFMIDSICRGEALGKNLSALTSNSEVINFVAEHPNAIGVIGVGWISNSRDPASATFYEKIKVLRVSLEDTPTLANSFLPFQANLLPGKYPLVRPIFLINVEPWNGLANGVTSFIRSDRGQRIILKTGVLPVFQTIRKVKIKE